jgi:hypothetical protein
MNAQGKMGVAGRMSNPAALPKFRAYNGKGELLAQGFLDTKGNTTSVYSDKSETVHFVFGDGQWGKSTDVKHTSFEKQTP